MLTRRRKKIVRTSNVRFDERKGLITDKEKKKKLISINQNPPNKEQHNAEERISTTLNNLKILKLDINKQIIPLNTTFNSLITDNDIYIVIKTSTNKSDYNNINEATESLLNITIKQKDRLKSSKNKAYIPNPIYERIIRVKTSRITKSDKAPTEKGNNPNDQPFPNVNPISNLTSVI